MTTTTARVLPTRGRVSPRYGHLGMWNASLGPRSPIPGERLEVWILDGTGKIVRRLEQVRGACTDPGYVDFFLSHRCRPSAHEYPIVDIDADGRIAAVLCPHFTESMGQERYLGILSAWVTEHGRREWAL